jgi:septum formation protein
LEDLERAQAGEGALAYVQRVTRLKFHLARRSARALGVAYRASSPILCADTTVVLDQTILGKPHTPLEARAMIRALSGRTHRVYTSVVVGDLKTFDQRLSRSWVTFAPLQARVLECYVQTEEWRGKAGGYAVQGLAAAFIEEIRGSYSGIMGLPLFETAALLDDFVKRRKT